MKELNFPDLKKYITSSRNCKFLKDKCVLEDKSSSICLNLADFDSDECELYLCKNSGNGSVSIEVNEKKFIKNILTKSPQCIKLSDKDIASVFIARPNHSIGSISLTSIKISGTKMSNKWKDILKKCKYNNIKLVNNKLLVLEGGQLKAGSIELVNTEPPNMYKIRDNKVIFLGPCEILDLKIEGKHEKKEQFLPHVHSSTLKNNENKEEQPQSKNLVKSQNYKKQKQNEEQTSSSNILYNSGSVFSKNINANNDVKIGPNSKSVVLGRKGEIQIPISDIEKNTNYIAVVEVKKTVGNGKIMAYILPTVEQKASLKFATPIKQNLNFDIPSPTKQGEDTFKLVISRPISATGEVVITKIMLLRGKNTKVNNAVASISKNDPSLGSLINKNQINKGLSLGSMYSNDNVMKNSKKFARFKELPSNQEYNIGDTLDISTFSGLSWLNKISHLTNVSFSNDSNLGIKQLGNLSNKKRIFLEEFINEYIKEDDLEILKNTEKIYTSSKLNYELLKEKVGDKIDIMTRAWLLSNPKKPSHLPNNYILIINRHMNITTKILEGYANCKKNLPHVVILGARGKIPNFAFATNEYLDPRALSGLIINASIIVDAPYAQNYNSALLFLSDNLNIPYLTSNKACLDYENSTFILPTEKFNNIEIPTSEAFKAAFEEVNIKDVEISNQDIENYNDIAINEINKLFI